MCAWLAVDFGTSNSAAAYVINGTVCRVVLEGTEDTIPTAVFFPEETRKTLTGRAATAAMVEGKDGRYMRSLKSVLGTSLMAEKRSIAGRRTDFYRIISEFIGGLKRQAESQSGQKFDKVVAGRPVFFDHENPGTNARAQSDLQRCFAMAGFGEVVFLPEPEAAALSVQENSLMSGIGFVSDIGGGTSDFTVFRKTSEKTAILASNGLRLGGTDFDRAVSLRFIMPLLGYGLPVQPKMSDVTLPAPNALFTGLATWQKIPFLYDPQTLSLVKELVRDAVDPRPFKRLQRVIELRLGHELALIAEQTKINANGAEDVVPLDLGQLEAGMNTRINAGDLDALYRPFAEKIKAAIEETIVHAGIDAGQVTHVVPVGGSSMMRLVRSAISLVFPQSSIAEVPVFHAVVDGLAEHIKASGNGS